MSRDIDTVNLVNVIRRQAWLIVVCVISGVACAVLYWMLAPVWYESRTKILVRLKDPGLATGSGGRHVAEKVVNKDVLANHLEFLRSRRVIGAALHTNRLDSLPSIVSQLNDETDATDYVIEHLKLNRGGQGGAKEARSLTMVFKHCDSEDARLVLEAVVQAYEEFLESQHRSARLAADRQIRDAQSDVEGKLKRAEQEYIEARASALILFGGQGGSKVYIDRYRALKEELRDLQAKESSIRLRLQQVSADSEKSTTPAVGDHRREVGTEGNKDNESDVSVMNQDLVAIAKRRRELTIHVDAAEQEAESVVELELKTEMLRERIDRQQAILEGLREQLRDLKFSSGLNGYAHELLDAPRVGIRVWPNLSLCGVGGVFIGLLGGFVLAVANEQRDGRFRSPDELDDLMNLSVLGQVECLPRGMGAETLIATNLSMEGEAFRSIRTILLPRVKSGELQVLAVSSPLSHDGRAAVVSNLAASFAQLEFQVIVIDADMRRPTIHQQSGVPLENGLADVLKGTLEIAEAIQPFGTDSLSVMTAGGVPGHPAELLESSRFDEILKTLSARFQLVLINVGPVLAVADACVVAQKADATLLVVRPSDDTRSQVCEAVKRLKSVDSKVAGYVINSPGSGKKFQPPAGYDGYCQEAHRDSRNKNINPAQNGDVAPQLLVSPDGPETPVESTARLRNID